MNDIWYLIFIAANLMWCFVSLKINDDWAETCESIIKELPEEDNT